MLLNLTRLFDYTGGVKNEGMCFNLISTILERVVPKLYIYLYNPIIGWHGC